LENSVIGVYWKDMVARTITEYWG